MRILYVHERFGSLGGAEANALITARELKSRGHCVGLIHGVATGKGENDWNNVFERLYPLLPGKPGGLTVKHALQDFLPDLVYVHKMADLTVVEALVSSRLPLVRMVHDHDIYCMRSYKYFHRSREICTRAASPYCVYGCGAFLARNRDSRIPFKYVSYSEKKREIQLNQKFDRMIAVSYYMKHELLKNGFNTNRVEIHPPVPRPAEYALRSNFSPRNLIIYAGQIIRGKGVDVLIQSLALLKVPFECIILGEGNHRSYCEELVTRLALRDRVTFKGFIPQEALKEYYLECSVVALSSVWPEPIATIGLEVMRYGLPVVAFDAGGVRDWLTDGENGFLIPWMDRASYAAALERLLTDKDLARRMGARGLQLVTEKFDFAAYIDALEDLFERVASEKRGAVPSSNSLDALASA